MGSSASKSDKQERAAAPAQAVQAGATAPSTSGEGISAAAALTSGTPDGWASNTQHNDVDQLSHVSSFVRPSESSLSKRDGSGSDEHGTEAAEVRNGEDAPLHAKEINLSSNVRSGQPPKKGMTQPAALNYAAANASAAGHDADGVETLLSADEDDSFVAWRQAAPASYGGGRGAAVTAASADGSGSTASVGRQAGGGNGRQGMRAVGLGRGKDSGCGVRVAEQEGQEGVALTEAGREGDEATSAPFDVDGPADVTSLSPLPSDAPQSMRELAALKTAPPEGSDVTAMVVPSRSLSSALPSAKAVLGERADNVSSVTAPGGIGTAASVNRKPVGAAGRASVKGDELMLVSDIEGEDSLP